MVSYCCQIILAIDLAAFLLLNIHQVYTGRPAKPAEPVPLVSAFGVCLGFALRVVTFYFAGAFSRLL